ncbi:MAG: prepilin-type N-terminal cleavage/methylation domain-containing protein [Syntrophomonadaceae bacterium]
MMRMFSRLQGSEGQKGFTLIELIIVMAVLTVLAAIAIPRYNGILHESKVKSDAITASGIASAARIQETMTGNQVISTSGYEGLDENYFEAGKLPSSGGGFTLAGGGNAPYVVTWTPDVGIYSGFLQTVTEGQVFIPNAGT